MTKSASTPKAGTEATSYEVDITMSAATVSQLLSGKYSLYGFKAVQSSGGGVPLVWFQTQTYATATSIDWSVQYAGYTSESQSFESNPVVTASNTYEVNLGDLLTVDDAAGEAAHSEDGQVKNAVNFANTTSDPFTCGLSLPSSVNPNGPGTPLCAFTLHGKTPELSITPIEKVVLIFATEAYNTGTVIEQAFGEPLLIDVTGVSSRSVTYDIDAGWGWGNQPWGSIPAVNEFVSSLVITGP